MSPVDRDERRRARQRGAWRDNVRELKDAEFSFKFGGTPSTTGRRSKTPSLTPATASVVRRTQQRSASRGVSQPREQPDSVRRREKSTSISRSNNNRSSSRALVTPTQPSTKLKRNRTEQSDNNIDELSEIGSTSRSSIKSRKLNSGFRQQVAVEEDELHQESPEHDISVLNGSIEGRRVSGGSAITPLQNSSASKNSTGRKTTISRRRVPLADIDENSVAFITNTNDAAMSDDEIAAGESTTKKSTSKPVSRRSTTSSRNTEPEQTEDLTIASDEEDEIAATQEIRRKSVSVARGRESIVASRPSVRAQKPRKKLAAKPRTGTDEPVVTIPIRVFRPSKKPQADADPLGAVPIPSLNPTDALSQCISEMCKTHIQKAKTKEGVSSRQIMAMVGFKNAIVDAFFDMSIAQNAVYALSGRLRKVKREQGDLRAELMRVKKQREEAILRQDSFRSYHIQRSREEEEKRVLVSDLQGLKDAARKYRETADEAETGDEHSTMERTRDILHDVNALVGNGGLLQTVRNWNSSMEAALEQLQRG